MASLVRTVLRRIVASAPVVRMPMRSFSLMSTSLKAPSPVTMFKVPSAQSLLATPVCAFHVKRKTNKRKLTKNYKLKSHRATCKRFDVTGTGRIMRWRTGKRHLNRRKTKRRLRGLSKRVDLPKQLVKRYKISMLM